MLKKIFGIVHVNIKSNVGNKVKECDFKWFDLCKFMRNTPITIKGCFGFGLKKIVENMKKHNMINTKLEAECQNGMMAMIKAWNCYKNFSEPDDAPVMKDISKYNEFDCKSMYDILDEKNTIKIYIKNTIKTN